jgi:hypothetical protein
MSPGAPVLLFLTSFGWKHFAIRNIPVLLLALEKEIIMAKKRFIVDLGTVELSEKGIQHVEASIQKAALAALAEVDFRGDLHARFPREWLGIWIDIVKDIQFNDKEFVQFAGRK